MANQVPRGAARASAIRFRPLLGRQLLPLLVVVVIFWLLRDRIPYLDLSAVWASVQMVSNTQWGLAALATGVSFWAVGRYDQVLHGLMHTGIGASDARNSGLAAIAVAQFAGFGVLSSALVRWRLLPGLSLAGALRISAAVAISFLAGWAIIAATVILATGVGPGFLRPIGIVVLLLASLSCATLVYRPVPNLPSVQALFAIVSLAFVDTVFACLALYVLLPADIAIAPMVLYGAFLAAVGCGLVGGTPGGVGPFELALLAMLPQTADEPLLAAALAFRLVYYVLPAVLAFLVLLGGAFSQKPNALATVAKAPRGPYLRPAQERELWSSSRAEANLIRQGQFGHLTDSNAASAIISPVGQSLVMLADPLGVAPDATDTLRIFRAQANRVLRAPFVYKCSARTALNARQLGWDTLAIASEAWLRPGRFSTDGPAFRQLRRLTRKAARAGVRVVEGGRVLPLDAMQSVSDLWASNHGGERGFSMGRFGRDYVSCQRVFLAYQGDRLLAFITLHEAQNEWTLDLMRHVPNPPDGTMHLLVMQAIDSAAAHNCPRLSLAAVPCAQANDTKIVGWLRRSLLDKSQTDGLRRFKASFDPEWATLYAAAPSWAGIALGLAAVQSRVNQTS